jgi:hypothetical protein
MAPGGTGSRRRPPAPGAPHPHRWSGAMLPSKHGRPLQLYSAEYTSDVWTCLAKTASLAVHFPMLVYARLRRRPPPPPLFAAPPHPRRWGGATLASKRGRPLQFDIAEYTSDDGHVLCQTGGTKALVLVEGTEGVQEVLTSLLTTGGAVARMQHTPSPPVRQDGARAPQPPIVQCAVCPNKPAQHNLPPTQALPARRGLDLVAARTPDSGSPCSSQYSLYTVLRFSVLAPKGQFIF